MPQPIPALPRRGALAVLLLGAAAASSLPVANARQEIRDTRDVVYATVDGKPLALDVAVPADVSNPPLLIWVHGGAWRSGDKDEVPRTFVEHGFATASVNYRLSTEARFPAAAHDVKAAIRFLRAHAREYGYRADRIVIAGQSAGAHLAQLVGVTNGDAELEGRVGGNLDESSDVQAILAYYGASNFMTILAQSTPFGLNVRVPALELWLGAAPDDAPDLARLASPVTHVDATDPPLFMLHGDQDPQMPINQSHELQGAYEALGLDVTLDVVHGAGHGGRLFYAPEHLERALAFLRRTVG